MINCLKLVKIYNEQQLLTLTNNTNFDSVILNLTAVTVKSVQSFTTLELPIAFLNIYEENEYFKSVRRAKKCRRFLLHPKHQMGLDTIIHNYTTPPFFLGGHARKAHV